MSLSPAALQEWLDHSLRRRLDRVTERRAPALPPPQVLVVAPGVHFGYGGMMPFHTASIGKVFAAVLAARYIEAGRLSLDDPIGRHLPSEELGSLPAKRGVNVATSITIEHLLAHRSGLPDPILPPRGRSTPCSLKNWDAHPERRWTLAQIVTECRGLPSTGRPGEKFHYSDGGYALLLRVLEEVGGASAQELLQRRVWQPSGMSETHQPHAHASTAELLQMDIAPLWLRGREVSRRLCLTAASADGGAVTTPADLVRFQDALHGGRLIDPKFLAFLSRPRSRLRPGIHYGAGLVTLRFSGLMPLLRGLPEPTGGLGLTATHAFFYAGRRAHVILNFHSDRAMSASFQTHIAIARQLA